MRMMPSQHYTEIKRSFFHHGLKRTSLDGCVEAMKGVYSSMRLCQVCAITIQHSSDFLTVSQLPGSFGNSTGLAVNVDVANGTFWIAQTLHQAARNLCDIRHRHSKLLPSVLMRTPLNIIDSLLYRLPKHA